MEKSILDLQRLRASAASDSPAETRSSALSWADCDGTDGSWFTWGGCY